MLRDSSFIIIANKMQCERGWLLMKRDQRCKYPVTAIESQPYEDLLFVVAG